MSVTWRSQEPARSDDAEELVERALSRIGRKVVLALPLGLGKGYRLANAFYRRAQAERDLELTVFTALALQPPVPKGDLKQRFLTPLLERLYQGVPRLGVIDDRTRDALPGNVSVYEFFVAPGSVIANAHAQQRFVYTNYTHATRDLLAMGVNVLAQMMAPHPTDASRLSLSCNPDVTPGLLAALRHREANGGATAALLAEVNPELPYFGHDAEVAADQFDGLLVGDQAHYPLPGIPSPRLDLTAYAMGLRASALIRDGGTLQIGIGAVGDALAQTLRQRHQDPEHWSRQLQCLPRTDAELALAREIGGDGAFSQGLYGCSEMFTEGLLALLEAGVLSREVSAAQQPTRVLDGGFFLGSQHFYQRLRELPETLRQSINMTPVAGINQLYGDESIRRQQRHQARFVNSALQASVLGAINADSLADGRTLSGVGGQYNFVAMAQELADGRSITAVESTRERGGKTSSNIVWDLPSQTIPRHLRDILVTEYGVADVRGRADHEVAAAIIEIADSRFQAQLVRQAKSAGKLPADYHLPESARNNTPESLQRALGGIRAHGNLPSYPFGTALEDTEQNLAAALQWLKAKVGRNRQGAVTVLQALATKPIRRWEPELERLSLARPRGVREHLLARLVAHALDAVRA